MPDWLMLFFRDIYDSWKGMNFADFAQPTFIVLWLIIIMLPLGDIDRRDRVAGMVYSLFCTAAGVALIMALPQRWIPESSDPSRQMFSVILMAAVAGFRWWYQTEDQGEVEARVDESITGVNHGQTK